MGDLVKPDVNTSPSREELQYLSREMRGEWLGVARDLKITDGDLYSIRTDNQGREQETIYQMLVHWKQKFGLKATRSVLAEALNKNRRDDLANYILTGVKPSN